MSAVTVPLSLSMVKVPDRPAMVDVLAETGSDLVLGAGGWRDLLTLLQVIDKPVDDRVDANTQRLNGLSCEKRIDQYSQAIVVGGIAKQKRVGVEVEVVGDRLQQVVVVFRRRPGHRQKRQTSWHR